jgi:hypothetical protein
MPIIPTFVRLRQLDLEFKVSMGYITSLGLKREREEIRGGEER